MKTQAHQPTVDNTTTPPNKTENSYKITSKYQSNGIWTVHYRVWEKGTCYCTAKRKTVELNQEKEPTVRDVKKVVEG